MEHEANTKIVESELVEEKLDIDACSSNSDLVTSSNEAADSACTAGSSKRANSENATPNKKSKHKPTSAISRYYIILYSLDSIKSSKK